MFDFIMGIIGQLLYPLFSIIFLLVDTLQEIFFALAGIGDVRVTGEGTGFWSGQITAENNGGEKTTGLIYYLLQTPLVRNMLISIMVLALFLLIIFTVMAFIKNAYSSKQKNWKEIIGNSIKGLANFVFIPVCCLLGVWASNILLVAINGATSTGGATRMSRKLFLCCAYDANKYRNDHGADDGAKLKEVYDRFGVTTEVETGQTAAYYAQKVDECYAEHGKITWWLDVQEGYHLYKINYLTLVVGGVFMLYVLITLAYGMVRRMFFLLMLYIISPAVCAMYPLDEGNAVGQWRKRFLSETIGAYGAVAGMNIFFSLLPIVDNINFMPWSSSMGDSFIDSIIQLLIMVAGLFVVKELISTISGFIGAEDAYSRGSSLRNSTKGAMKKYAGAAVKGTVGAFAKGAGAKAAGGKFWSGFGSSVVDSVMGAKDEKGNRKGGLFGTVLGDTQNTINDAKDAFSSGKKYGANTKNANDIFTNIRTAKTELDTADAELQLARDNYDAEKAKGTGADPAELARLRGILGAKTKARNKASRNLDASMEGLSDLEGYALEKVAKKTGVSAETLKASYGASKEVAQLTEKHATAKLEADAIVEALRLAESRTPGAHDRFKELKDLGIDLEDMANKMGKSVEDLIKLFQGGVPINIDERDSSGNRVFDTADKQVAAQMFNRTVEEQNVRQEKVDDASKALIDYVMTNQDKFRDDKGNIIHFDKADLDAFAKAVKSGDTSAIMATKVADSIKNSNKDLLNKLMTYLNSERKILEALQNKK